jgi:hypothetical protein
MNKKAAIFLGGLYTISIWMLAKKYYTNDSVREEEENESEVREAVKNFTYPAFKDRHYAELLFDGMKKCADIYGAVSIGDMYNMIGKKASFDAYCYGWKDTSSFVIDQKNSGYFYVYTGNPVNLDK